ncbi:Hypothetical predicted protein, partial [Pelobates cultripes]
MDARTRGGTPDHTPLLQVPQGENKKQREERKGKEGRRRTQTHTSVNTTQGHKSDSTPQTTTRNNCSRPTPKPTTITRATKKGHRPVMER